VELLVGEAAAPAVPEASYDVVVSVFAAVFAPDPRAALEGMVRALAPDGRIVLTAWVPGSPIAEMGRIARAEAAATPPAPPFPWHEVSHVRQLAATMELEVEVQQHELAFVAASPEAYLAAELEHHPATRATRAALERAGRFEAVRHRMLDVLTAGNEDPDRFRVTSRYLVYTLRRRVEAGRG
jgi:SAM-dependent methyltransferase